MLVKAAKEDIERYMDFAYALAMDQTRSGYPLWSDGVSTKAEFVDRVWESYEREDRDLLLFVADGAIEGWVQFFFMEEERYLQTDGFLTRTHTEQAITEFLEYAHGRFAGYDLYFGFPKRNTEAIAALQKRNCRLIEEAYHDIYVFDGEPLRAAEDGVVRVTESNFPEFSELHQTDPETYWTSERMLRSLDEWLIYLLYRDGAAVGYVCARDGEIFSLGYRENSFDKTVYQALVRAILRDFQAMRYRHMIFFNDDAESQSAALELGFSCVSEYVLFVTRV